MKSVLKFLCYTRSRR